MRLYPDSHISAHPPVTPSRRRIPSFSIPPELIASSPEEISFAIDPFEAFSITAHNSSPGFALSPLDPLPEDSTL